MSRKVVNITHSANKYDILSQTPKNYDKENYFLKELQEKVLADWNYRPNRVDIEFESVWGKQVWEPLEVVVQSVLSEKGSAISNDTRNLVFKNILEDRFNIGNRFRFSEDYDLSKTENQKNVWMVTNLNKVNMTSSVTVVRCNGTLGSVVDNGNGTTSYHYEPVIQGKDLTSVNFFYNETLISPQSQLSVIAQYNEFTKQYKINQRFIIGPAFLNDEGKWIGSVYRIKAINRFYGNSTFDPQDVGLVHIYMEVTESSAYDKWVERIAYNETSLNMVPIVEKDEYTIQFEEPIEMPSVLPTNNLLFKPVLYNGMQKLDNVQFSASYSLQNLRDPSLITHYIDYQDNEDGTFIFKRLNIYTGGNLIINFITDDIPNIGVKSIIIELKMVR